MRNLAHIAAAPFLRGRKLSSLLAPILALLFIVCAVPSAQAQQSSAAPFSFRAGQRMYIVAYRRIRPYLPITDASGNTSASSTVERAEYSDYDLDAERKVRKRIEEWRFFQVAEKPSVADFVFLVSLDESSIEGLVVSFDAYRDHFKDRYDLDELREAAHGRYLIGPLKLGTVTRLADRLVKQFREKVMQGSKASDE
ncbi:MAG: hypothetical protein QOF02_1294 [Blastocatellia bacterium]|jgi:hypothetical protein|nr:hypothetical protein [Blastocatellia bacterium]